MRAREREREGEREREEEEEEENCFAEVEHISNFVLCFSWSVAKIKQIMGLNSVLLYVHRDRTVGSK